MPIDGVITAQNAPVPQAGPATFAPSSPTAPHAAEVARSADADPKEGAAAKEKDPKALVPAGEGEAKKEGETKEEKVDAWRLASLAQKEKAARARAEEAKKAEQGLKARMAEIEARETRMRQAEENHQRKLAAYRANPLELLREYGLDYNQVSEYVARGNWSPEQAQAMALRQAQETAITAAQQVEALRKEQAEREAALRKELEDKEVAGKKDQVTQAVQSFKNEIGSFLEAEPESYELSNRDLPVAIEAVYEYIDEQYAKTGKVISTKAAADYVESRIFDELQKIFTGTKKFGNAGKPAAKPPATLSNRLRPAAATAPEERGQETEAERRARVVAEIEQAWAARRK